MNNQHLINNQRKIILLIALLGSIIAIGPLAIDMYLPAFSKISEGFFVDESKVQLSLASYFIGMALSQIFYGPIIDRFGKKSPLFFGLCVFIFTSICCAFATKIEHLIILRFFQALGGCACVVIPRAIVRDIFPPQESAKVFSHLMLVMGVAPILAPTLGSLLLEIFSWRAIFIFLAGFGVLCFVLAFRFIPETKAPNPDDKISHALKKYLGILKDRNFTVAALSGGFAMAGLFAYITGSSFIYMKIFELSAKNFSLLFAMNSIGFIIASQINARLLKKFSMQKILEKLLFVPLIFGSILIFVSANEPSFWSITILFFIILASVGGIVPNTSAIAMSNQAAHSGSASALLGTIQFIIATITSLLVSHFFDGTIFPLGFIFGSCAILSFLTYKFLKK